MGAFRWVTSSDPKVVVGSGVPDDRRSRHPGGHSRRRRAHRAAQSVAAHLLRDDRREFVWRQGERRPAADAAGSAAPVHAQQQLVPANGKQDRHDRDRQARRSGRARSRLLRRAGRPDQTDPIGADGRRRPRSSTMPESSSSRRVPRQGWEGWDRVRAVLRLGKCADARPA